MLCQLNKSEYKATKFCDWRLVDGLRAHRGFTANSGLHPAEQERHDRGKWSKIALMLVFGYLNCRQSSIIALKYSTEGGARGQFFTGYQMVANVEKISSKRLLRIKLILFQQINCRKVKKKLLNFNKKNL